MAVLAAAVWLVVGVTAPLVSVTTPVVGVTTPALVEAASTARGFATNDSNLAVGMAVSLSLESEAGKQLVETATRDNKERFVGIVTTKEANSITVGAPDANVYVTTNGEATGLATDLNGAIKAGDFLTISPIDGIIMKADTTETDVLGVALEDFKEEGAKTQSVKDDKGATRDAKINPLMLEIGVNTRVAPTVGAEPFLLLFGRSLTGKPVSQWQVIGALLILFLVLVVEGSVIYGAAHSTIQAIGRNPLATKAVFKQFIRVLVIAIVILLFGAASIYAILWA